MSSSASQSASTSFRARGSGVRRLMASHLVWRMSSGATRTRSASGPEGLRQLVEEVLGGALDEQAPGPPVHRGADPVPTERRGDRALGFDPVGPDEDRARLPPAIKSAKDLAVQNASGCFHRFDCTCGRAARESF